MSVSPAGLAPRRDLVVLPTRRLLAIDAGAHTLKLLLTEEMFGRFRVLRQELVGLRGETAQADETALRRARALVQELGDSPVAVALPHSSALSQVVDLPGAEGGDVRSAIEEETRKVSGLGESQIVHDYSPLTPFGRHANPFWVTLCKAAEVQREIERCGVGHLDLCEVTTTANALVAAFQSVRSGRGTAVLVDGGATGTGVTVVLDGQPVYTASFPLGGDALAAALAAHEGCSAGEAESLLISGDLFEDAVLGGGLAAPLGRWTDELQRVVGEWLREHPELKLAVAELDYYLCGGLAEIPGLVDRLGREGPIRFRSWPSPAQDETLPPPRFAAAWGAALHALGRAPHPASLLPDEVRVYWNRHHSVRILHSVVFFLLAVLVLGLGLATWQKVGLLLDKRRMLEEGDRALEAARLTEGMTRRLAADYAALRPVMQRQVETLRALQTLTLLQQARSNRSFWYVLFADDQSYYRVTPLARTNAPGATNSPPTNALVSPTRPGFIAELSVPEQGEARRRTLNQLVADLRRSPLFSNVDSLPEDRRRSVADPAVVLPESHSALHLELARNPFDRPERPPEGRAPVIAPVGAERREGKRAGVGE